MRRTTIAMSLAFGLGAMGCCPDKEAIRKSADDILTKIDAIKAASAMCKSGQQAQCDNINQAADDVKTDATDIKSKVQ